MDENCGDKEIIEQLVNEYVEATGKTRENAQKWVKRQFEKEEMKKKKIQEVLEDVEVIKAMEGRKMVVEDGELMLEGEDGQWYQAKISTKDPEKYSRRKIKAIEKELKKLNKKGLLDLNDPQVAGILKEFKKKGVRIGILNQSDEQSAYEGDEDRTSESGSSSGEGSDSGSVSDEEESESEDDYNEENVEELEDLEDEEEIKRHHRCMKNPYYRDLMKKDKETDGNLLATVERPLSPESDTYKTKNELLRRRLNELLVSNTRLKNRVLQVRKEVSYSKKFRRCLVQKLTSKSDVFASISLEIPSEPCVGRDSDSSEIVDSSSEEEQEYGQDIRQNIENEGSSASIDPKRVVGMENVEKHRFAVPHPPKKPRRQYPTPIGKE